MELFAEPAIDWLTALLVLVGTTVGGAVVWVANFWIGRSDVRRGRQQQDEKKITDHQEALIARQSAEISLLQGEVRRTQSRVTTLTGHVLYLQGIMEGKGVRFRPLVVLSDGSTEHEPLSPDEAGENDDSGRGSSV